MSLKQLQLYELNPCLEEDADEDSVKIEALDDAIILERDDENLLNYGSETFEEFKPDDANGDGQVLFSIVKERKTPRKQTIESLAKQTLQQTHKKDLIECNECGLLLANGISLKRHNERVRNFFFPARAAPKVSSSGPPEDQKLPLRPMPVLCLLQAHAREACGETHSRRVPCTLRLRLLRLRQHLGREHRFAQEVRAQPVAAAVGV